MTIARTIEGKAISTQIKGITSRASKLEADIHACAVNCIGHALTHGDFTLLSRLVEGIGMARTNAIKAWAEKHAGAKWKSGSDNKPGQFGKNLEKFDALVAEGVDVVMDRLTQHNPFVENKEPTFEGLDFLKAANALVARAEKLKASAAAGDEAAIAKLGKSNLKGLEVLKRALANVEPAAAA